jgi:hypothetical protein
MASWIVHLRIAEKLLEKIEGLGAAQFAIGNVAPDSGRPDEKWENFDPPTQISHFKYNKTPDSPTIVQDILFYQEYISGKETLFENCDQFSFLFGYFCHLVTDNLWAERVWRMTKKDYAEELEKDPQFIWEVKKDWYGLDFAYVRAHPECLFWSVFVDARYQHKYLDFFPDGAIAEKLAYIRDFYQRTDEDIEAKLRLKDNVYFNQAEMNQFIDDAVRDLEWIYRSIWERGESVEGLRSAVELLS